MDDVGLPRSSLLKALKDQLPADLRIAGDASDLVMECCNQFVHLVSTQANAISERDKRSTISPEHVVKALEELEFGPQYVAAVKSAWEEWKADNKEHHGKLAPKKQSGMTQQQLIELQNRLFEEARAATLSGPLPSLAIPADAVAAAVAAVAQAPAQQEQQQEQQQQQQQQQQAPAEQGGAAAAAAAPLQQQQQQEAAAAPAAAAAVGAPAAGGAAEAGAAAAAGGDDTLSDEEYSGSSQMV